MLYQDNYFVVSVKLNLCYRQRVIVLMILLMMKVKFSLLQILTMNSLNVKHQGKMLQSTGISTVSLRTLPQHSRVTNEKMTLDKVMNIVKSYISEPYKVQAGCLEDSESDSYDKNDMKENANDLVRF